MDDVNPIPELRKLEEYIMENANKLGIGTMGFGGNVTLLGCKIGVMNRLPASFFVSVAYNCWAFRRQGVLLDGEDRRDQGMAVSERGRRSADGRTAASRGRGGSRGSQRQAAPRSSC